MIAGCEPGTWGIEDGLRLPGGTNRKRAPVTGARAHQSERRRGKLESLGQFFREGALRTIGGFAVLFATATIAIGQDGRASGHGAAPAGGAPIHAGGRGAHRTGSSDSTFGAGGGWAGFARRRRSSRGARSKRLMIRFISSSLGASMKAKPLDSWVSGLRMTFTQSATRLSETSHCLTSSAVTHVGRLPRKTVELIELGS